MLENFFSLPSGPPQENKIKNLSVDLTWVKEGKQKTPRPTIGCLGSHALIILMLSSHTHTNYMSIWFTFHPYANIFLCETTCAPSRFTLAKTKS